MSAELNEQYRVGFEAWARKETYSLHLDNEGYYLFSDTLAAWNAWCAAMQQREASTEPSAWMCPGAVEPEFTADALLAGYWMRKGRTVVPLYAGAGALPDEAKAAALRDALNTTLWLYRRLPVAYGKPPFVDAAIMAMAKHLNMDDVPIAIKERASLTAHKRTGSGKCASSE